MTTTGARRWDLGRAEDGRQRLTPELEETFVLLDSSSGVGPESLLFSEPQDIIVANNADEVGDALARLQAGLDAGLYAAGFLAYELGYVLEPKLAPLMPTGGQVPLIWLGLYREPREMTGAEVDHWLATHKRSGSYKFEAVTQAWDREAYEARFASVQEKIRAGDIYQINLTFKARFRLEGSPLTFYQDLRKRQRVAYGAIVDTGEVTVLSASPELFIEKRDDVVFTRPMKGTAPRAGTPIGDEDARHVLSTDTKQRAENLMIVDLMRNDIGRIAEIGSVEVTDLFTVETFRTLHQMTSGVKATLSDQCGMEDLVRATFPPGSVIGAPKIRAMELIREYETEPRGVYCGSVGYFAPDGSMLFNVAIRTPVVFRDGRGEMGIGSGVVYDSVGSTEYAECLLKMKFLTDPPRTFELIETLLYEPSDGYWLLDGHLKRLEASAQYFGYAFDRDAVLDALRTEAGGRDERLRVRLLASEDGSVSVSSTPLGPQDPGQQMRFVVSETRVDSADMFLYHKTTRRELYNREWAHFSETLGTDDVIYLNERDEVAEGSRTNVFVKIGAEMFTPSLSSGLLPGVLRSHLIDCGEVSERVLTLDDLRSADAIYLGNSVRGLVPAEPVSAL